jgi:hypothetical protein
LEIALAPYFNSTNCWIESAVNSHGTKERLGAL